MSRVAGRAVHKDINMLTLYVVSSPENLSDLFTIFFPSSKLPRTITGFSP